MKFTLAWLKDHLDTSASVATLTEKLALIGLDVEGVDEPAAKLQDFTIARVVEAKRRFGALEVELTRLKASIDRTKREQANYKDKEPGEFERLRGEFSKWEARVLAYPKV